MKYRLLRPSSFEVTAIEAALAAERIATVEVHSPEELSVTDEPVVLVLDSASRELFPRSDLRSFVETGGAIVALGSEGEEDVAVGVPEDLLTAYLPFPHRARQLLIALRTAFRASASQMEHDRLRQETADRTKELSELSSIGAALNTEKDYNTLLDLILSQARQVASADAGSLYLVQDNEGGQKDLQFKLSQTYSRPDIPLIEFSIPIDHSSIAGYVASTGEPLVIDDAYELPENAEYSINRSFDEQYGYRTKSMLTIPMTSHKGEVIGVLQLLNRKQNFDAKLDEPEDFEREIIPYNQRNVEVVSALAGQAAVSIENSKLYEDIEKLFEGFVTAAVTAIEQRDPTTFGHSGRVAGMTVGLAVAVNRTITGPYGGQSFSPQQVREIRYAGLLHDFGKVGVREQVLVKAKKLYPPDLALVKKRYGFIRRTAERDFYQKRTEYLERRGSEGYDQYLTRLTAEHERDMRSLDRFVKLVLESNEPTVLPEGSFEELLRYADVFYRDIDDNEQAYLTDDEVRFLTIRKGSLDETERLEIESHVNHTYRFLMQIPWTRELQDIPTIAWGHHEKLDGSGYPNQTSGNEIRIQTRMMTIADIYDALTASDRPYKRAVPAERALGILNDEVNTGMLDQELFRLFTEAKVFDTVDE
jgi:HD-GYP domain-containing protein (c-di-GMP phosphodiesterase class II)